MGRARLPVKGARGPSQGKTIAQARWDNLAIQPRTVQSSVNPKFHRKEGQKRYMTKLERKSKNIQGKLPLLPFNTLHLTESYSSAFTTTPNDFWVWADGTSISLGKVGPTRGRRTANAG